MKINNMTFLKQKRKQSQKQLNFYQITEIIIKLTLKFLNFEIKII